MSYRINGGLGPWIREAVQLDEMEAMAELLADPNPIHFDPEVAAAAGLERPINHGPANVGYVASMLQRAFPDGELRQLALRLRHPVLAGDRLTARGRIKEASEPRPGERRFHCDVWLDVEDGPRAAEGHAIVSVPIAPRVNRATRRV